MPYDYRSISNKKAIRIKNNSFFVTTSEALVITRSLELVTRTFLPPPVRAGGGEKVLVDSFY